MDIIQTANDAQKIENKVRLNNGALGANGNTFTELYSAQGYNASTGKFKTISSSGRTGTIEGLTNSLPFQGGKPILIAGDSGLF